MQSALKPNGITITGAGFYVPASLFTNLELAASLDTSDEWITQRTGIRQRYIAEASAETSDLAVLAATHALHRAQLSSEDVDLIVVATSTLTMLSLPRPCWSSKARKPRTCIRLIGSLLRFCICPLDQQ